MISACSATTETVVEVRSKPISRPSLSLPPTTQYSTRPVEWIVITKDNIEEKFSVLEQNNEEYVFFALSTTGYENLSMNMADILRFTREQNAVIIAYRNYYERTDSLIRNHNSAN